MNNFLNLEVGELKILVSDFLVQNYPGNRCRLLLHPWLTRPPRAALAQVLLPVTGPYPCSSLALLLPSRCHRLLFEFERLQYQNPGSFRYSHDLMNRYQYSSLGLLYHRVEIRLNIWDRKYSDNGLQKP